MAVYWRIRSNTIILDADSDPSWPNSSGTDQIQIQNTGFNTRKAVLISVGLHEHQVHGGINTVIKS
jgi:hypothetical protein